MRNKLAQHIDFSFMEGIIPNNPKWLGCNIDMCCERRNKFLFAEWKRPNEKLPKGQEILLESLSNNPNCFVYIIDGYSDETGTEVYTITRWSDKNRWVSGYSIEDLKGIIVRFYKWADKLSVPNKS